MKNILLKKLILRFRNGDMLAFDMIYDLFKRLIYLYSGRLADDDAVQELTLFLIELLYSIDLTRFKSENSDTLKRYIAVSIKNRYLSILSQNSRAEMIYRRILADDDFYPENCNCSLTFSDALQSLLPRQRIIIIYKYIYCYTDSEIAEILGITRQAVNRLKKRGLESLRNFYGIRVGD